MTDHFASQGQTPVTAYAQTQASVTADQSAAERRAISAESFRRLTALLKKPLITTLEIPKLEPKIIAPPLSPSVGAIEQLRSPQPVQVAVAANEPLHIEEKLQNELPVETLNSAASELIETQSLEAATEQPEHPAPTRKLVTRPKARDAFAVSPGALPPRQPAPLVQQTPEQEQEAAELARSLLDMMSSGNSAGLPQERALAADTLLRMLPRLPLKSLIMLSERVRLMESPPPLLMAKLISDQHISVAGPLLEDCMHITDEDLAMVIGDGDYAKIRIMARRRRLSRAITSELVKTGDDSVLLTLVRNLGAEIPQESYLALSEFAKEYPDLLAPLCTRPDLPVPFAFELFWLAPVQLRRYILSRFLTDSETLTKILKITRVTAGDEQSETHFAEPENILAALELAGEGDIEASAAALSHYANVNSVTVERILSDNQGEPLAALLKACGIQRSQVSEIFEKLQKAKAQLIDKDRVVDELQSTFDSLSFNKARILLTYWDWATLKTGPYAPLN